MQVKVEKGLLTSGESSLIKFSIDFEVVRWLGRKHSVIVVPGSASGGPRYIRISLGGLKEADCEVAAQRLKRGQEELVRDRMG
ncbi:uncharacterized protein A4U43_C01F19930 [Asparagus officinalis]|uniref:Aminotransferase class I/classII domain-containing protein n=1 Tax=Asparagus officinalis TaxID=4686 RepID=A0A5P1FQQ5_ASPOF|nr:uncharacterized protein A4U43_C01F19930 [Asparagus officinalis]